MFVAVAVAATALLVALSRHVFLFWDDFVFLGEAREADLTWGYLTDPLFKHFSPVMRLISLAVVPAVPGHAWVVPLVLFVLLACVAGSVTWLMVVLHGRTVLALVGSVVLAPSLTLLQLGNWWTAGINIMPALAGCYLCLGAMVQLLRHRSQWWGVAALAAAALGVLDYELPMLLIGYAALWLLLFGSRVTGEPWRAAVRRTWWAWAGLAAICVAAAVNYRVNYYDPVDRPSVAGLVHALGRSLVRTLIPTALGFHDPHSHVFSALSLVVGCLVLAGGGAWLLATRTGAWRGLAFAAVGWLLPTLALVLNRVSIFGITVVDNAIYFHLPTVLAVVGVLEAVRAPRRTGARRPGWRPGISRVVVPVALLAVVAGYAWSAGPTARYQLPVGATPSFVERARDSARALRATGRPFSVLDSDVPGFVVPGEFTPYNRADRVLGVVVPGLTFDDASLPLYHLALTGALEPVSVDWVAETTVDDGALSLDKASRDSSGDGLCFTAATGSQVVWALPAPVAGPDLVVRTVATVDRPTAFRVVVRPQGEVGFDRANRDAHELEGDSDGVLDTVAAGSVATLRVKGFTPGVHVCVESVSVGRVAGPTG